MIINNEGTITTTTVLLQLRPIHTSPSSTTPLSAVLAGVDLSSGAPGIRREHHPRALVVRFVVHVNAQARQSLVAGAVSELEQIPEGAIVGCMQMRSA